MTGQKKTSMAIEAFLVSPDKLEFCSPVKFLKNNNVVSSGILAAVAHPVLNTEEACLILCEESEQASLMVWKIIPIFADLNVDLVQSTLPDSQSSDLLATISVKQDSATVIFPEKEDMSYFLRILKLSKSIAEANNLTSDKKDSHEWTKSYSKYGPEQRVKKPVRANSLPNVDDNPGSALRYVLPLQRAETIQKINLKRTKTVVAPKDRLIRQENAKSHWINNQLMKREDEFVTWQKTTAFVGTWNVHGQIPSTNSSLKSGLQLWLQDSCVTDEGITVEPDFYIIGLQEMETNTEAYLRYDPLKETQWVQHVLASLKDGGNAYYKVESKQLVTMLIIVIAKKTHKPFITEVYSTYAGVGIMNLMGNKGGVAVRLRFHDSYLCFVTSHLAAFADKTEKRNQDFTELSKRLNFPNSPDPVTEYVSYSWNNGGDEGVSFMENNNVYRDWRHEASIFHNDFLIWCGDLNYRVNLNEAVIKNWVAQDKLDLLLEYDQLSIERGAGRTFPMFDEGPIHFPPTYKYDVGTNRYDTSEKRRAPSWTDRVLFKKSPMDATRQSLTLLSYTNCMEMMASDHKPVRALLQLNVRKIDSRLQTLTRERLIQQIVDHPDTQPRGDISSSFVIFGKVRFMEYKEKTILLENTGQVLMLFKFISSGEGDAVFPPWLQVEPSSGVLAPGEKVVLRFEITVDPTISAPLNRGEQKMAVILILRLENCKDFFIDIDGDYIPTCFGVPLEQLSELTVPILEVTNTSIQKPSPVLNQIDVPKELWMLMNFLWNPNMFSLESLFLEHGDLVISTYIRDCLDNGNQFDANVLLGGQSTRDIDTAFSQLTLSDEEKHHKEVISANSMIDVLVAFLECLPEPVISTHLYERALEAGESVDAMNTLKESLAPFHRNVLLYIGIFLRQAIDASPAGCRNAREDKIIETFTVLLRPPIDFKERNPAVAKEKREKFITQLLKTCKA